MHWNENGSSCLAFLLQHTLVHNLERVQLAVTAVFAQLNLAEGTLTEGLDYLCKQVHQKLDGQGNTP